ncbi:hypothetical protein PCANC_14666 [Puccinia coronata f. sp. avenae]|uniref:Uncharacterized protein n=1 Tax=Puccinia coronata f. sp. avenae TaxID=200324 RepID=A0A2N5SVY9_9BASI|nr:hypothetical protein PCANC_14666 [Puccinia coronata f. sp. avenae]PLW48048.1 hypothetical protein PCASD_03598 [Puccinia coronata f. sp. avenae]
MLCSIFWVLKNVASPEYPRTLDLLGDLESLESLVASSSSTRHRKAELESPELHMEQQGREGFSWTNLKIMLVST